MSLSGNLGFVSLDEVLRLLTRSGQQGSVDVQGAHVRGRVFITKGGVGLATTSDDDGLRRHLIKSGLVDESALSEGGVGFSGSPLIERGDGAMVDLLREMTVESIYQLGINGESFEVNEGVTSPYGSPKTFELEELIADSKQRLTDWAEVSRVVSDLTATIHFVRDLGDREGVAIDSESWKVLSEVGSGASVVDMADALGTTEFWTARVAAGLINEDLVAIARDEEPVSDSRQADTSLTFEESEPVAADTEDDVDPNESWWEEPRDESESETHEPAETPAQETSDDGSEQIPALDGDDEPVEVEEDTEAFLEKVFSELESPEEDDEEGYGLLRRRRMGATRDLGDDG